MGGERNPIEEHLHEQQHRAQARQQQPDYENGPELDGGLSSGHGSPPEDVCRHITHPFTYCRWEGCLCIDLDDRIVGSQLHCVGSETVVVGGSRTIPEAHNFAKRRLRRTDNHHSQSFLGMNWVEIQKNSSDLGHYFLPPPPPPL